jgi:hypothetical protein
VSHAFFGGIDAGFGGNGDGAGMAQVGHDLQRRLVDLEFRAQGQIAMHEISVRAQGAQLQGSVVTQHGKLLHMAA